MFPDTPVASNATAPRRPPIEGLEKRLLAMGDIEFSFYPIARMLAGRGVKAYAQAPGEGVLAAIHNTYPDLCLVDFGRSWALGLHAVERIRQCYQRRALPVIAAMHEHDMGLIARAMAAGVSDYVTHPPSWPTWWSRLAPFLEGAPPHGGRRAPPNAELAVQMLDATNPDLQRRGLASFVGHAARFDPLPPDFKGRRVSLKA